MEPAAPPREAPALVIFGDFNCPFSALASARAAELEREGQARVDWHAVEHDPFIPVTGEPVVGQTREDLSRELAVIRKLLGPDEADALRLPSRRVNTHLATSMYAAVRPDQRPHLRRRIFATYWGDGLDLADPDVLARLGAAGTDEATAARWDAAWRSLPQRIVPSLVLPDGHVSRGLGALARLADGADGNLELLHGQPPGPSHDNGDRGAGCVPPAHSRQKGPT